MQTITLAKPWTFRSPLKTVTYPAGDHEVPKEVAEKASAEGVLSDPEAKDEPATPPAAKIVTEADARRFASAAVTKRKARASGKPD